MRLFKIEVKFKRKRRGRIGVDTVVHARSRKAAEKWITGKYTGCTIESVHALNNAPRHFVLADLEE